MSLSVLRWMASAALMLGLLAAAGAETTVETRLELSLGEPVALAGQPNRVYARVAMRSEGRYSDSDRPPVNLALVLDKSRSMAGPKIRAVRQAALAVMERMSPRDLLSIVLYDTTAQVLMSASSPEGRAEVLQRIETMEADGETALFAGLSKGASEIAKNASMMKINRILLISDGMANVGPNAVDQLSRLGESFGQDGLALTSIGLGLGYHEDLLYMLAERSGGAHYFVENPEQLTGIVNEELDAIFSVVAQRARISVRCDPDFQILRVLGHASDVAGHKMVGAISQLYGDHWKFFLIEMMAPSGVAGETRPVLEASVQFWDIGSGREETRTASLSVRYSDADDEVRASADGEVMADAVRLITTENTQQALTLRDQGQVRQAADMLILNYRILSEKADLYNAPTLLDLGRQNRDTGVNLEDEDWGRNRKQMRVYQNQIQGQQQNVFPFSQSPGPQRSGPVDPPAERP